MENKLLHTDNVSIISDEKLFMDLFYEVFISLNIGDEDQFYVVRNGLNFKVYGSDHIIKSLQFFVNLFRILINDNLRKNRNFSISFVEIANGIFITETSDIIDLTNWLTNKHKTMNFVFEGYIKPCLAPLCKRLQIITNEKYINQKIRKDKYTKTPNISSTYTIDITFRKDVYNTYLITPKIIEKRNDLQNDMYILFKKQILCDFKINIKDKTLYVHSQILYIYGGPVLKSMMMTKLKESINKMIDLSDYSSVTINTFVDYLYLGPDYIDVTFMDENNVDINELFHLAHFLQIDDLMNHCINLYNLSATIDDSENILELYHEYNIKDFKSLYDALIK